MDQITNKVFLTKVPDTPAANAMLGVGLVGQVLIYDPNVDLMEVQFKSVGGWVFYLARDNVGFIPESGYLLNMVKLERRTQ